VWHPGLLYKLAERHSVAPTLIKLLASYMEGRQYTVVVEGTESTMHPNQAEVPQGSVLSPILYAALSQSSGQGVGTTG
jgi:hypothetical protein